MQSGSSNGLKQVGVLVNRPNEGGPDLAPPEKLTHVTKAEMYACRYGDKSGQAHTVMLVKAGDQWYMPPNAEQWAGQLRPVAPWLLKQLNAEVTPDTAPKADTVDVLGAGG